MKKLFLIFSILFIFSCQPVEQLDSIVFDNQQLSKFEVSSKTIEIKKIFEKNSDLFIAFPGGVGTLDEIVDIINRNILKEINKKLFLINDNSYWKKFNELLDYFKLKHFTSNNYENHNFTTCNLEQLKKEIKRIDAKNKS